jgi:hypothetical protein
MEIVDPTSFDGQSKRLRRITGSIDWSIILEKEHRYMQQSSTPADEPDRTTVKAKMMGFRLFLFW